MILGGNSAQVLSDGEPNTRKPVTNTEQIRDKRKHHSELIDAFRDENLLKKYFSLQLIQLTIWTYVTLAV